MELFLDERCIENGSGADDTVEQTLRRVQADFCGPGQLIVRLRCDGKEISAEGMADALRRKTAACGRLEMFTTTRGRLVLDAMNQSSASLRETEDACERIVDSLARGKIREGMEALGECLRIWQQVHLAVTKSIQMLQIDTDKMAVRDETLTDVIAKPREVLLQMKEALVARDHVLLADLLQYELCDVTHQWYTLISRLREEAETDLQSTSNPRR